MHNKQNEKKKFKFLPLTLGIETLGGICTPLVLRGTPLPATRQRIFSTAADNQKVVTIRVLLGESPIASSNIVLKNFDLKDIPDAPRGEPEVQVSFEVDGFCNVRVKALEKKSGARIDVEDREASIQLSDEEIQLALEKSEANRSKEQQLMRLIEAKNRVDTLIHKAEQFLKNKPNEKIEGAVAALGLVLEREDEQVLRKGADELEKLLLSSPLQNYGDFGNIFGNIFEDFFGAQHKKGTQPKNIKKTVANHDKPKGTSGAFPETSVVSSAKQRRKNAIFGGSEFTLDSNLCFVLMPFNKELEPIYDDHIRTVVEAEKLKCLRADEIASSNLITWDIWEKINRARFIIADLSGRNPNVFYEVGLAHAIGKEVILLASAIEDASFDLQSIRCIVYSYTPRGMKDMEEKLKSSIRAILHSGDSTS
jgi:hypothetical protein